MGDGNRVSLKSPSVEQMMAALQCVSDKDDGNYNIEFTLLGSELGGTEFHKFVVGHPALVVMAWEAKQLVLCNGDHIIVVKLVGGGHNSGFFEAPFDEKTPKKTVMIASPPAKNFGSPPVFSPPGKGSDASSSGSETTLGEKKDDGNVSKTDSDEFNFPCSQNELHGLGGVHAASSLMTPSIWTLTKLAASRTCDRQATVGISVVAN